MATAACPGHRLTLLSRRWPLSSPSSSSWANHSPPSPQNVKFSFTIHRNCTTYFCISLYMNYSSLYSAWLFLWKYLWCREHADCCQIHQKQVFVDSLALSHAQAVYCFAGLLDGNLINNSQYVRHSKYFHIVASTAKTRYMDINKASGLQIPLCDYNEATRFSVDGVFPSDDHTNTIKYWITRQTRSLKRWERPQACILVTYRLVSC